MNNDFDQEIDLLLRRHTPSGNAVSAGLAAPPDAMHLDADELSAYAEQRLPAATRLRYQSHLTDCTRCRQMVTNLVLAQASAAQSEAADITPEEVTAKTSLPAVSTASNSVWTKWRTAFASLFATPTLRYAVPALVLLLLGFAAFIALRAPQDSTLVALRRTKDSQAARNQRSEAQRAGRTSSTGADEESSSEMNHAPAPAPSVNTDAPAMADSAPATSADTTEKSPSLPVRQPSPHKAVPTTSDSATGSSSVVATAPSANERPSENFAAPPPAAAGLNNEVVRVETSKRDEAKSESSSTAGQPQAREAQEPARTPQTLSETASNQTPPPSPGASLDQGTATKPVARNRAAAAKAASQPAAAPTASGERQVGGRRFRQQNGIWIDSAYQASTATTNVQRGSEQYRALITNEPSIGQIAEQLDGEVIVVWKGRAYKIQ